MRLTGIDIGTSDCKSVIDSETYQYPASSRRILFTMKSIIIFGAGNIGRVFIGQIFSNNGYNVTFADIQKDVIENLNKCKSYPVVIRQQERADKSKIGHGRIRCRITEDVSRCIG